jgi:hypothetical protein
MTNDDETKSSTTTGAKTMWSETLLEALYVALEKKVGDAKIREILGELKTKGYKRDYLVEKVTKKLGPNAADRLKRVYAGMKGSAGKKQDAGLIGKFKGMFK